MSHAPSRQALWDVRLEWGERGLAALRPGSDALVIVDVLSFSTCVDVAVARGARIVPVRAGADDAGEPAAARGAERAGRRGEARYSLSPASFLAVPAGTRVVLPSPNGAALSAAAGDTPAFAGCLRNAGAVAEAALRRGPRVALLPAGERWPDGSLRPCLEDALGAGALADALEAALGAARLSPEARAAAALFRAHRSDLAGALEASVSGRELAERGFPEDVRLAAEAGASACAPRLRDGAYGAD